MKMLLLCGLAALTTLSAFAQRPIGQPVVIDIARFGARPDSKTDSTPAFQQALREAAKYPNGAILRLAKGRYDFFPDKAARHEIFPANLMDSADPRTIALDLQGLQNLTIDGQGALLVMRARMSILAAEKCTGLTLKNIAFDFARPTVSEIKVLETGDNYWVGEIPPDETYVIEDGKKLVFTGENWRSAQGFCVRYDAKTTRMQRVGGNDDPRNGVESIKEIRPRVLRFEMSRNPQLTVGNSYQYRDTRRENVGLWFSLCRDVRLENIGIYANDGFAIHGQQTENFSASRVFVGPRPGSGRTAAAWADILHFTECKGRIDIRDSVLTQSHDDVLNVQGINFQITERIAPEKILVRFAHGQAWGFQAFFPGDEIEFIRAASLRSFGAARVKAAEMKSPKEMIVTLDKAAPEGIELGKDCVENITWTPSLHMSGCRAAGIATRGLLISTRQPVLVESNNLSTTMEPILIADDANSWFESGPVRDVTIRKNDFAGLAHPAIRVHPEVRQGDGPVHRNIRIEGNTFHDARPGEIDLSWVEDVRITGNRFLFSGDKPPAPEAFVRSSNATGVEIKNNTVAKEK